MELVAKQTQFDFWALPRPLTKHWGSGATWERICDVFGIPDAVFGKTDGIPNTVRFFDHSNGHEWKSLPCAENEFAFGYWDPPYDALYKPEAQEIWRCCQRLAILHTFVYPRAWFQGAHREAMVAVTMGPLKQVRCLQVFRKIY